MSTTIVENCVRQDRGCRDDQGWHPSFLNAVMPAVQTIGRIRFRGLPAAEREEALAEAMAAALVSFVRLTERGKTPASFATRLARVAVLRVLAGRVTACPDRSYDVSSRLARQRWGFRLESLDSLSRAPGQEWEAFLAENRRITPADLAASRIDFREWLGQMPRRRRAIAETLAAGYRTEEVAEFFRLSPGRVSQLRREFEASWHKFQSDGQGLRNSSQIQ